VVGKDRRNLEHDVATILSALHRELIKERLEELPEVVAAVALGGDRVGGVRNCTDEFRPAANLRVVQVAILLAMRSGRRAPARRKIALLEFGPR
jgi:hypothetical protein